MHLLIKMFLFALPVKRTQPAAAGSEAEEAGGGFQLVHGKIIHL